MVDDHRFGDINYDNSHGFPLVFPWFRMGFLWFSYDGGKCTTHSRFLYISFSLSLSFSCFLSLFLSFSLTLSLSVCLAPLRRWADSWRLWQQGHLSIAGSVGLLEVFIGWVGSPGGAYIVGRKGHPRGNKKNIYYRYWLIMVTPYPCGKKIPPRCSRSLGLMAFGWWRNTPGQLQKWGWRC